MKQQVLPAVGIEEKMSDANCSGKPDGEPASRTARK